MLPQPSDDDWERIHRLAFVDQPGCWTTCGGGHCCKFDTPELPLRFMKPGVAGMVFFEGEYAFLDRRGLLQEGFKSQARSWSFPLDRGLELRFVTSVCALGGKCSIPAYRPLLCKLYPFLPRFDLETLAVTGYVHASVIDQLWPGLASEGPCTLVRGDKASLVQRQIQPGLEALKQFPYVLLHLKAAELFLDEIAAHFERLSRDSPQLSRERLIATWEVQYLSGKAFEPERLRSRLREERARLARRFPGVVS